MYMNATIASEKRVTKRGQLWSNARRVTGLHRSKSTPVIRPESRGSVVMEASPRSEGSWREDVVREKDEEDGQDVNGGTRVDSVNNDWADDAASTHTAFREERPSSKVEVEDEGDWAPNLFYAYARRTDDPRFSRFLLTFSTARICAEWWSLLQQHFGASPSNSREGPQFFSFTGDDIPGRAWKHAAFSHLKTKWMYSQLGDAVGAMGKGQEIIPLQDERGFPAVQTPRGRAEAEERSESRMSFTDSLPPQEREKMAKLLRRSSKRDSGILLSSSPLINGIGHHERSLSLPVLPPDSGTAQPTNSFDPERMEQNLARIERLMDSNASQLRTLEHVQAANLERLTAALISNAEMVRELGSSQMRLGEACEELRRAAREGEERNEKRRLREEKKERIEKREREARRELEEKIAREEADERTKLRSDSVGSVCSHEVKRGPRKLGRPVIGYVYAAGANGEGQTIIMSAGRGKTE